MHNGRSRGSEALAMKLKLSRTQNPKTRSLDPVSPRWGSSSAGRKEDEAGNPELQKKQLALDFNPSDTEACKSGQFRHKAEARKQPNKLSRISPCSYSGTKDSPRPSYDFRGQPAFTLGSRTMTSRLLPHMIPCRNALCIISWHFINAASVNQVRALML